MGCKDLPLQEREVDFHFTWLSQLAWTGVCTKMAWGYARLIRFTAASSRCDEPLSTTQNCAMRRSVFRPFHDVPDQSPERFDAGLGLAQAHDPPLLNVPGGQGLQRPAAVVFRFDSPAPTGSRPEARVTADAGLDADLLVRADDPVERIDAFPLSVTFVEIQDDGGLLEEVAGTGEDPVFVLPRLDGILVEDSPDCAPANRLVGFVSGAAGEIGRRLAAQRFSGAGRHITGDRGDHGPVEGGKRPACDPGRGRPRE